MFGDLLIGAKRHGNLLRPYAYVTITPTHVCNDNTNNLPKQVYDAHLKEVVAYIEAKYRIVLGMKKIKIRSMEINCNILLDDKYSKYTRVIKLLMSFCSNTLRQEHTYRTVSRKGAGATTYMRCNNSWAIVVYNKSLQMEQKHPNRGGGQQEADAQRDLMRVEVRLYNDRKIKSAFGTNYWSQITDQQFVDYYHRTITRPWMDQYETWIQERHSEIKDKLEAHKKNKNRNWRDDIMHDINYRSGEDNIPYILDIEQVQEAYLELADVHRNRCRASDAIWDVGQPGDLYHRNDRGKVAEIFEKMCASMFDARK